MPYNEPEPEQSRYRCGMFTIIRAVLYIIEKGEDDAERKDGAARSIGEHSGL